jgi:glyoxylase-like metal-dependent hydrolase (beta-lactamase superfamily II)
MYKQQVGHYTVSSVQDYAHEGAIFSLAPNADPQKLSKAMSRHGVSGNMVEISYNPVLVDTGQEKILIDTGWGQWLETGDGGTYHGRLHDVLPLADIDIVVLTHAHADHYGGLVTENGTLIFPNATYMMSETEWNAWASDEAIKRLEQESNPRVELIQHFLHPLQPRLSLLTDDNPQIAPGITAIHAPGHTPGHIAVRIANGTDVMLCASDAVVHPIHIERLDWHFANDTDHTEARTTREKLLAIACEENALFHAYHFAHPGIGRIAQTNQGYSFDAI